jgi:hypothetical protein
VIRTVLKSPLHRPLSGRVALITVTGRRSGRNHTFPVGYSQHGEMIRIGVGWPERKNWWRNLLEPAPVRIRIRGEDRPGSAVARGDAASGVDVDVMLD